MGFKGDFDRKAPRVVLQRAALFVGIQVVERKSIVDGRCSKRAFKINEMMFEPRFDQLIFDR